MANMCIGKLHCKLEFEIVTKLDPAFQTSTSASCLEICVVEEGLVSTPKVPLSVSVHLVCLWIQLAGDVLVGVPNN